MTCTPPTTELERTLMLARLRKLEGFYDDIISGQGIRRFEDQNGEKVEYSTANATLLASRIRDLRKCLFPEVRKAYTARPAGFVFPRQ